jgi:uncharacterized protein YjbJ (UPF0337 family)
MTLEDKIKATAKDVEGRLEAAAGAISGDERMQAEGEAKQVQAQLIDAAGTVKDNVQKVAATIGDAIDGLPGRRTDHIHPAWEPGCPGSQALLQRSTSSPIRSAPITASSIKTALHPSRKYRQGITD